MLCMTLCAHAIDVPLFLQGPDKPTQGVQMHVHTFDG